MEQSFNTNISFIQPKDAWDALSMREKAEMMKVAVNHGITNLQDIRQRYNEFAMGGDTEDTEPLSLNEAKRMGVMVGASLFKQPKAYIGGTPSEARDKYWQQDNEMRILTDSVASRYNLNPDLLRSRMDSEGYTDSRIAENNIDVKTGSNKALTGEALFHSQTLPVDAIHEFGFDDVATYINNGTVSLINENWGDGQFENEKGRTTHAASGHNYSDNIGIMAATLKGLREVARKDFPNASEADLDRYAQAYYNRGITGGREWVKRGAKGYKVTKHSLGGPLVDAAMNEYKSGGKIYIKPSHRGRLTELKKRTGKTEAELYNDGNPAHKKMVVFARNARKFKHGYGGNLFDGTSQSTQQMNDEPIDGGVLPEIIINSYEDPMIVLTKENPEYKTTLGKIYENDNFSKNKAMRLLEVYDYAGRPKLMPLQKGDSRAYTHTPSKFTPWQKTTLFLNTSPRQGLNDLYAELSHPIQAKYGNNNPDIEDLNPFYNVDDYRGMTRYDFPNKYESETHRDFEPVIKDYINRDSLFGQVAYTNSIDGFLGTNDTIPNPTFKQVLDSARAYNKRKQEEDYHYKTPLSIPIKRNKIKSFLGNRFSNE